LGHNQCECFQIKPIIKNKLYVVGFSCKRIVWWLERKKCNEELELQASIVLLMMIGASISQFCSLDDHPFYKLHGLVHVPPPFVSMVKYVYALLHGLFYIWQSRECMHAFVPKGFICQQMCMEFLWCNLTIFATRQSLNPSTSFNCLQVSSYQNGGDKSSHLLWFTT
jgi:hypothetical protein